MRVSILITIPTYLIQQSPPPHNAGVGAVLVTGTSLLVLGERLARYGPGLLICALLCFAVPQFVPQAKRAFQVHASQFLVLSFIPLLVSRVADVGRKHRAVLAGTAEALEEKVRSGLPS